MFADVTFSTEGTVLISALLTALAAAIVAIFKLLINNYHTQLASMKTQYDLQLASMKTQYDAQLASMKMQYEAQVSDLKSQRESYKEIAEESSKALEIKANEARGRKGKAPLPSMASVVPEHHSKVSPNQQEAADMATIRARLTAASLELDLPPRQAKPPQEPIEPITSRTVEAMTIDNLPAAAVPVITSLQKVAEAQGKVAESQERAADKQEAAAQRQEDASVKQEETAVRQEETAMKLEAIVKKHEPKS